MLKSELISRVEEVVQDPSYTQDEILGYLNEGLVDVAAVVKLPDLLTNDTVTTATDAASVSLPSDYHRGLFQVYSVTREHLIKEGRRLEDAKRFFSRHPGLDRIGDVFDVAVSGKKLWYQAIPDAQETLRLFYYRLPNQMTSGEDTEPDGIPPSFHTMLVSFAAMKIFNRIEDGLEPEQKINTNVQASYFQSSKNELAAFLGPEDETPDYVYDEDDSIFDHFW
jgi:hypothetical protein